jgi:hypothetical protein
MTTKPPGLHGPGLPPTRASLQEFCLATITMRLCKYHIRIEQENATRKARETKTRTKNKSKRKLKERISE